MKNEITNKKSQLTIFLISLLIITIGVLECATSGISEVLKFNGNWNNGNWSKGSGPFILLMLVASILLYYSARNLYKISKKSH